MTGTLIGWVLLIIVFAMVVGWFTRKKKRKQPDDGPAVPNLATAEDIMRIEELHDQGKMTDEEYHTAKGKLLS